MEIKRTSLLILLILMAGTFCCTLMTGCQPEQLSSDIIPGKDNDNLISPDVQFVPKEPNNISDNSSNNTPKETIKTENSENQTPENQVTQKTNKNTEPNIIIETKTVVINKKQPSQQNLNAQNTPAKPKTQDSNSISEPNSIPQKYRSAALFHDRLKGFFLEFVNEDGLVDYKKLKRQRKKLSDSLENFKNIEPNEYKSWHNDDKMAFWINAYNLNLLKIIIENYPIKSSVLNRILWPSTSLRHIPGIWTQYKFMVMDEIFTLNQIEERFFNKTFNKPTIYFAVSRASMGGPPLRNEPYYGYKLNQQLEDQIKNYLSSPKGLEINTEKQSVYISSLLSPSWHAGQFVEKYGTEKKFKEFSQQQRAILNFTTQHIPPQQADYLQTGSYKLFYINYDWRLNEQ